MNRVTRSAESALGVVRDLRTVFTMIPWRMRWRIIGRAAAAFVPAILDLVAVTSMLPLTQLLMSPPLPPSRLRRCWSAWWCLWYGSEMPRPC